MGGVQYFLYVPFFRTIFPKAVEFAEKPLAEKVLADLSHSIFSIVWKNLLCFQLVDKAGQAQLVGQVVLDQFVHHPLMYFPVFYLTREFVTAENPSVSGAIDKYKSNITVIFL